MNRREFLRRGALSALATGTTLTIKDGAHASRREGEAGPEPLGTVIDLTVCDGCSDRETPACVTACREENAARFPEPRQEDLQPYWPQKKFEDWSRKRDVTDRLTPYNWTTVQKVEVEHGGETVVVNVPRRCMHCDSPSCVRLCPFGSAKKTAEGPVVIDPETCFGGAKCRTVCPWDIPARQAGVGIYLDLAPKLAGGGVMYKCDLCHDRVAAGSRPACVEACPRGAISFGPKAQLRELAHARASEVGGFVYGDTENGGTSTFYVSAVPFEAIHRALAEKKAASPMPKAPGYPLMPVGVENILSTADGYAAAVLLAPVAGVLAAGAAVYREMKKDAGSAGPQAAPPRHPGEPDAATTSEREQPSDSSTGPSARGSL